MNSLKSDLSSLKEEVASGINLEHWFLYKRQVNGATVVTTNNILYGTNGKITNAVAQEYRAVVPSGHARRVVTASVAPCTSHNAEYVIFNAGYTASSGGDYIHATLICSKACYESEGFPTSVSVLSTID